MKALSIQQPWADRILFEGKDIENRTWWLPKAMLGQRIYVHAGKRPQEGYLGATDRLGAILGEVTIVGCTGQSRSPWFEGPYGFMLENPVAYESPIPYKGALGFFDVTL